MFLIAEETSFLDLIRDGDIIPFIAVTLGMLIGLIAVIGGIATSIVRSRAREQTRREIAAYVAEGTMDADKAIAILNAGESKGGWCKDMGMKG